MNGSIEVYSTSAGRRYRVRYRSPDRRQHNKRGFTTKREAESFLSSIEVAKSRGVYIEASAGKATIRELGTAWIENHAGMKPSALRSLESAWRVHVLPAFGGYSVVDIRHSDVQKWVAELAARLGFTSVSRSYGVLAGILDVAVRDRRISSNPARGVKMPRRKPTRKRYLDHAQVAELSAEVTRHGTLVIFLSYTGLRFGEATGLRVQDLDLERSRVRVVENAVMVAGTLHVGTPKTHQLRTVPFPAFLTELLAFESTGKSGAELLFGDGHSHVTLPHSTQGWFAQAVRRLQARDAGYPTVTPHDLRHTAASLAVSAGANVKAVQRMLGHASAAMTLDTYAELFDDDLNAVAIALDRHRIDALKHHPEQAQARSDAR